MAPVDAGVVDQDIQTAILGLERGYNALPPLRVDDIESMKCGSPAVGVDLHRDGLAIAFQHVSDDDMRTFAREEFGLRRALAARNTRDQRHFACQSLVRHIASNVELCRQAFRHLR